MNKPRRKKISISCVIPAHNEEKSIRNTLKAVSIAGDELEEVILVDDGSTDKTAKITEDFPGVKLLRNEKNRGKSKAVARGIREAKGDFVFFLDADLIGLEKKNISAMVAPVKTGEADVVISIRGNTPKFMKKIGLDCMSGERILPRNILMDHIGEISSLRSFGLEVYVNSLIIKHRLRIMSVKMDNVKNDLKFSKRGFWRGIWGELLMWRDLFRTVSVFEFVRQNVEMRKLLVRDERPWIRKKKINLEYLKVWREIYFGIVLLFRRKKKEHVENGKVLVVVPCLIGEFAAAIPALFDFILRNRGKKVDLFVSPPLAPLAEAISGAGKVFSAVSNFEKRWDFPAEYERVIILRINRDVLRLLEKIRHGGIETALGSGVRYMLHLAACSFSGRSPKRWRTFNFEYFGGKDRRIPFEEIFADKKKTLGMDAEKCLEAEADRKKIVIHTGTHWPMKHWAEEKWADLIWRINETGKFKFVFVGGEDSKKDFEYISKHLDFPVCGLIKKTDTAQLLFLMREADFFIGIDSGPANLAHLAELRSLTLYGPGPHLFRPTDPEDIVIDKTGGRGFLQLYLSVKNSHIGKIFVDEVFEAFCKMSGRNKKLSMLADEKISFCEKYI